MSAERNSQELWGKRAIAFDMLARAFYEPTEGLAMVITSGRWRDALLAIAHEFEFTDLASCPQFLKGDEEDPGVLHRWLRIEWTHLFAGVSDAIAPPYEGVWRARDEGVPPVLFANPHTIEVERFCGECGLERSKDRHEPFDNIATELEFLRNLACAASGIFPNSMSIPLSELPGGSPESAYALFVERHAKVWMPSFAEAVIKEGRMLFYKDMAAFLKKMVES